MKNDGINPGMVTKRRGWKEKERVVVGRGKNNEALKKEVV